MYNCACSYGYRYQIRKFSFSEKVSYCFFVVVFCGRDLTDTQALVQLLAALPNVNPADYLQSNFNGSNTFGPMKICSRLG